MSPVSVRPSHRQRSRRPPSGPAELRRREALKLLASGALLPFAGCAPPMEEILPYVDMPEGLVPGEPLHYASALPLAGFARGVVVKAVDGRPVKIAGNPRDPASLGATDVFAEAEIFSLYDPNRSRTVRGRQPVSTWNGFLAALQARLEKLKSENGAGLRLVTGRITSPTLLRQISALMRRYPAARWHAYEPTEGDMADSAMRGRPRYRFAEADIIVSLDADPLGPGPRQIANARAFAERRRPGSPRGVSRVYIAESTRTLTGANADHRLALAPAQIAALAEAMAARLSGGPVPSQPLPETARRFLSAAAGDIGRADGRALLMPGETLPPASQARIADINRRIGAPVEMVPTPAPVPNLAPLADLWRALETGAVTDLVVIDRNPCHDFPDAGLREAMGKVDFSVHAGLEEDETAQACRWHLPLSHMLESWSDLASADGTVSIVQPLIRPLYATRSAHEVVACLLGEAAPSGYEIVRETWRRGRQEADFERWWRNALIAGFVEEASGRPGAGGATGSFPAETAQAAVGAARVSTLTAVIRPDPTIFDGRFAGNAWLQECPKPIGKQAWSNVVALSPADARRLAIRDGDVVAVSSAEGEIAGTAHVEDGQAEGAVGLTLGYGREFAGAIGSGLGYNPRLLAPRALVTTVAVTIEPTGVQAPVPSTQGSFSLGDEFDRLLPQVNSTSNFELRRAERREPPASFLHPDREGDGYRWAMVIDTAACIGCNACVLACQVENNIPVVGPDEVANSRIMHWLRIDRYEIGDAASPFTGFEPVPCMHCEKAPCEPVCPVGASIHDVEGLNDQVYNRCVGTRFCQSNCPYKVRRFNWFAYGSGQEYADLGDDPMPAAKNPDVTVRARGVMEKCTYCVQRISRARREAKKTDRPIGDGEVMTACQQACPTRAISFGNLADEGSHVSGLKRDPRHFVLLEELNTGPRTTYLARVRNVNPDLDGGAS